MTELLIFRTNRSPMFFKIGVLKNFTTFSGKTLGWLLQASFYRAPAVVPSGFSRQKILFFSNLLFMADSHIRFCLELLWKHELNLKSSNWKSFVKEKGVLRNFANFTGKHLCWSLFLIELQAFGLAALLKIDSNTDVFLRNLKNF